MNPLHNASDLFLKSLDSRALVQDACPLAWSIEWRLGQHYFLARGNKAFINDSRPVPFAVNNDGNLSARAAELLFVSLEIADGRGTLGPEFAVLELGFGVGLFARFTLDRFSELCERHGKDYHRRLLYVAADRSPRMLLDACRHGDFANHPGRYLLRVVDADDGFLVGDPALTLKQASCDP